MPPSRRMMYGYISMLQRYFNDGQHKILFTSPLVGQDSGLILFKNTINFPDLGKGKLNKFKKLKAMFDEADRIVFHSYKPDKNWAVLTYLLKKNLDKSIWIMWGIDLYNYKSDAGGIKGKIENYMGETTRRMMRYPVAIAEPDIEVYNKTFGEFPVLLAPYAFVNERFTQMDFLIERRKREVLDFERAVEEGEIIPYTDEDREAQYDPLLCEKYDGRIRIQIGHNGFAFNNQVEVLNALDKYMDHPDAKKFDLCFPISYGNTPLSDNITFVYALMNYAKMRYPNNVSFLNKLIPANEYTKYLSTVDIAIFNSSRQNGLGNILQLLYMGKKVYMSTSNPLFEYLRSKGFEIHDVKDIDNESFEEFVSPVKAAYPNPWIKNSFGMENCAKTWRAIFDYVEGKIDYDTALEETIRLSSRGDR